MEAAARNRLTFWLIRARIPRDAIVRVVFFIYGKQFELNINDFVPLTGRSRCDGESFSISIDGFMIVVAVC